MERRGRAEPIRPHTMTPRPYQYRAYDQVLTAWLSYRSVLLQLATGAGKTLIARMIIEWARAQRWNVLFLVHRDNLLRQASNHFHEAGIRHGLVSPRYPHLRYAVQVASVFTAANRLSRMQAPDVIIIDEAHHLRAATWERIIAAYPEARVLGVTATPTRLDGRSLGELFEAMILGPPYYELIADGWLSPYRYYAPETLDTSSLHVVAGEYDEAEVIELVDKPKIIGDGVRHYREICDGAPALAYCVNIAHAEHVAEQFRDAGYRSETVHSRLEPELIDERLGALKAGELDVLTSVALIGEGTDIPGVVAVLQFAPWNSLVSYMQACGRSSRPVYAWEAKTREERLAAIAGGPKPSAYILDFVSNYTRHGFPDDPREWTLSGDGAPTVYVSQLKRCPECYFMAPRGAAVCPECGTPFSFVERELPQAEPGELQERLSLRAVILEHARCAMDARGIAHTLGYAPEHGARLWLTLDCGRSKL